MQQQFADLKCGLALIIDKEWESFTEAGNLARKKRKKDEQLCVPTAVSYPSYKTISQLMYSFRTGGFTTHSETLVNFVEIVQALDKILTLELDAEFCDNGNRRLPICN